MWRRKDASSASPPRVLRLASAYLTSNVVSTLLQPACDRIARATGASCTAAVLEAGEAVMIARALPLQLVPAGAGIGYRLPAYCSALGRVLLAALPADGLAAYLDRTPLTAVTSYTLTDRPAVAAAIASVQKTGFSLRGSGGRARLPVHRGAIATVRWLHRRRPQHRRPRGAGKPCGDDRASSANLAGRGCGAVGLSCLKWCRRAELNRGPTDYESVALPLSYAGKRAPYTAHLGKPQRLTRRADTSARTVPERAGGGSVGRSIWSA